MTATATLPPSPFVEPEVAARLDSIVERASAAADAFRRIDQDAVDRIVRAMVVAGVEHAVELAQLAMEETGFGVFEDKVIKNYVATEFLHDHLRDKRTVGVIERDEERSLAFVAEPIGVVLALLPITNPTSTALFKAIVAAKTRNAVVFRPSARAARCAERAIEVVRTAGEAAGLPPGALQVVPDATLDVSQHLFHHPAVDFIWTTGGPKAVRATNEAGKPCIGVGPGNAPVYIHRSADLEMAVMDVLISKTFDASVICPAEQTLVVDDAVHDELVAELERMGARLLSTEEVDALASVAFEADGRMRLEALGQACPALAALAGLRVDAATKVLLAPLPSDLEALAAHPLVREKLMPVLGVVRSPSAEHAIDACVLVTEHGGLGHTSAVYAEDPEVVERFAEAIRTGRILVNAPTAVGALGGVYNELAPTFSLGCGTWGGSTTTHNVNYRELLNVKVVSHRQSPPQWFRAPSATFFNAGALGALREAGGVRALIVTDAPTEARGVPDEIRRLLAPAAVQVHADVDPEPHEDQVRAGAERLAASDADLVVAVGGGSVIDAAKAMRLLAEHPELTIRELALPFLDPRKRVARFPQEPHRARLIAVPTTAGTGSEVSPAAVLTVGGAKLTLVDYSLVPDQAIIKPRLTLTMPPALTAATGVDALTHALEAYVSIFASPYTDALCLQAAGAILRALPRAYAAGDDLKARTEMANGATIAGLALANAFVGVNHALAHAVGARFGLAHGRANALFLPHVLRYNAAIPSKFMPAPGYGAYVAPEKYAEMARVLGLGDRREALFDAVDALLDGLAMPRTAGAAGIDAAAYRSALPDLAMAAFADLSNRTNPRMPLVGELRELLERVA